MNPLALIFFLICAGALFAVPRGWAVVPLLIGCTYMTLGQGIEIGPISLPVYRMMLLVGLLRVIAKGEGIAGGMNIVDKMMICWGIWMMFASFFHDPDRAGPVTTAGEVFNLTLIYFLVRIWCSDLEEVSRVIVVVAILLVPIAIEMAFEKATGKNLFSIFGGVPENVVIREGKLRAQGPFRHPILAGTVGATCIPLFIGILRRYKTAAMIGIGAGMVMVFASASSGPVMSFVFACGALICWRCKSWTPKFRLAAVMIYLLLLVVMAKPPYYLIARIDISGGSTGWHRAFLIENTFKHFSEWWLFGTDVTRHWMPLQGIAHDPNHTDITNYYIGFGVAGGLTSMLLVIGMMMVCFRWVGQLVNIFEARGSTNDFLIWCFGASLFSHAATSISVAYFDQSMLFFWLTVAVISSVHSIQAAGHAYAEEDTGGGYDDIDPAPEQVAAANAEWRRRFRQQLGERAGIYGKQ
jgi:hypothetical protein